MAKSYNPYLKYSGSKIKILPEILNAIGPISDDKTFIDVFGGSGSVCLNVDAENKKFNDLSTAVINIHLAVVKNYADVIEPCYTWWQDYQSLIDKKGKEKYYNQKRAEYNETKSSSLYLFLNRTCFNGLTRFNATGKFNVPCAFYKKIHRPLETMRPFSILMKDVEFTNLPFEDIFELNKTDCVFYCDPPYAATSDGKETFKYTSEGFSPDKQVELATVARKAANNGNRVIISNAYNEFTTNIYSKANEIHAVYAQRSISGNSESRIKAKELIAIYY